MKPPQAAGSIRNRTAYSGGRYCAQIVVALNLDIATKLGVLNSKGLADMHRGQSPTIQKGPYTRAGPQR